jgi:hypothetical protein
VFSLERLRGLRLPQAACGELAESVCGIISHVALRPVTSAPWRELIKRVGEVDPLRCPRCGTEMVKLAASSASLAGRIAPKALYGPAVLN